MRNILQKKNEIADTGAEKKIEKTSHISPVKIIFTGGILKKKPGLHRRGFRIVPPESALSCRPFACARPHPSPRPLPKQTPRSFACKPKCEHGRKKCRTSIRRANATGRLVLGRRYWIPLSADS